MYSKELMKYLLTYQKENNKNQENNKNKEIKIKKSMTEGKYATVPIRYTK